MKFFVIPAVVLTLLLGISLWNAEAMDTAITPWCAAISEAQACSERGDWDGALRIVRETQDAWDKRRVYFHIVTAHDELEAADALFAATESYATEQDGAEFRAGTAQLIAQLLVVAEMQQLTLRNVL